jgi:hypothetical protein
MKQFQYFIFSFLLISPLFAAAQLHHFIYFQTEARQSFYARLDKNVLSSSASGYLIIPKLHNGSYTITIGFPKNEIPEQTFVCTIENKDAGYLVKNFGEKGWGLFNLQTLDVVMAGDKKKEVATVERTDEFSNMLSAVVNDPAVKQVEIQQPEVKQQPEQTTESPQEAGAAVTGKEVSNTALVIPASEATPVMTQRSKPRIIKKLAVTGDKGVELLYIDSTAGSQDTVQIFIPVENNMIPVVTNVEKPPMEENEKEVTRLIVESEKQAELEVPVNDSATMVKSQSVPVVATADTVTKEKEGKEATDQKFLPIEIPSDANRNPVPDPPASTLMINSDCKNYATEEDFLKFRKKMAAADNDDEMITVAQKFFKVKCYSTGQIKNLAVLFLNDAGRYRFFDLAYPYAADSHNFDSLESQLIEPYYKSRFKAMLRN